VILPLIVLVIVSIIMLVVAMMVPLLATDGLNGISTAYRYAIERVTC